MSGAWRRRWYLVERRHGPAPSPRRMSHLDHPVVAPEQRPALTPPAATAPDASRAGDAASRPAVAPRARPRARLRELVGPAVFEASFVVLGVVLAYAVNEWREAREHRRRATAATSAITAELQANRDAVRAASAYHLSLLDTLRVPRAPGWRPSPALFSRGFVAPAQLSATAWETAAQAGVMEHIPYPVVLRLSRAYAQQARYEQQAMGVGELIYAELYRAGTDGIVANHRNLGRLIGALQFRERHLGALYDSTLADSTLAAVPHP